MADRQSGRSPLSRPLRAAAGCVSTVLRRLHGHVPNSTQVVGFLTLVVSGCILLVLTGLALTGAVAGVIFLAPLIMVTSPIWVFAGALMFLVTTGFLSTCGLGVAALASATWLYRYSSGRHPVGSERMEHADL